MKNVYEVKHFWFNPRNNETCSFKNKQEALEEMKKMTSADAKTTQCSILYKNGVQVARRAWGKNHLSWDR